MGQGHEFGFFVSPIVTQGVRRGRALVFDIKFKLVASDLGDLDGLIRRDFVPQSPHVLIGAPSERWLRVIADEVGGIRVD
eukprot:3966581-Heterocapsa_arctica.AAC.1